MSYNNIELIYLWGFRIAVILIAIASLMSGKDKLSNFRYNYYKAIENSNEANLFTKILNSLSAINFIKVFIPKENSPKYKRMDELVYTAGKPFGLSTKTVFTLKISLVYIFILTFGISLMAHKIPYIIDIATNTITKQAKEVTGVLSDATKLMDNNSITLNQGGVIVKEIINKSPLTTTIIGYVWSLLKAAIVLLFIYNIPNLILLYMANHRRKAIYDELILVERCLVLMMEAATTSVFEILTSIIPITNYLKNHFITCVNEYYINPENAIKNLANRINTKEFDTIARAMILMESSEKAYTIEIMKSILDHYKKMKLLEAEEKIKRKPILMTILMVFPLISFGIIWLAPWIYNFMKTIKISLF
ncbi:MAG: hypothetical protein ACPLVF_02000 [Thermovenabulum sp.]|uniref:hypothetical protein n=1 Tax=Thermovenabulum sp. TaxID=3100335 RepID=UPI003C7CC7BE